MRNFIRWGMAFFLALTFTLSAFAQTPTRKELDDAYYTLRTVTFFAIGGVGYGGTLSEGELALHTLLQQKKPDYFLRLMREKNTASRAYGLLGLRHVNAPQYRPWYEDQVKSKENLRTMEGCVMDTVKLSDKVIEINKGDLNKEVEENMKRREKKP